ncbi:MAG: AMP-binding protein [Deltaproteobacteria bacterium]|nr:AMP-binding protein [Deltaproteobacteria bacterium]
MDLGQFIKTQADRYGDKHCLQGEYGPVTYAELDRTTNRLAAGLQRMGVNPGDRVATLHPNSPQLFLAYLAIIKAGGVVVPVNPIYTPREIRFILNDSGVRNVLAHENWSSHIEEAGKGNVQLEAVLERRFSETVEDAILGAVSGPPGEYAPPSFNPDMPAFIFYTSGTTGHPKGVILTHRNLTFGGPNVARNYGLRESDITLAALPMVHIFCIASPFMGSLSAGGTVVVMDGFKTEEILEAIGHFRVTWFPGVPTMFTYLLNGLDEQRHDISSLRMGLSGGASLPVEVLRQWEARFKAEIIEVYGLTESTGLVTGNPVYGTHKPGSIGIAVSGVAVRLVDHEGNDVPEGSVGHLIFRGANATCGYYNLPELTAERIRDGWVYTGDHAYRDREGYYFIAGREAEMIISGGYNIYPREIEEILYAYPGVNEAAVIGVPHESKGEVPKAFVSVKPGAKVSEDGLLAHCRDNLAPYKQPVIEFMAELPKNTTGKIMKNELPKD